MEILSNQEINDLVVKNRGLAWHIAKKFKSKYYEEDDLASIGFIGLIKAANTYNSEKGIKFATYASRCIENEILMCLRKEKKYQNTVHLEDIVFSDDSNDISLGEMISDPEGDFAYKIETELEEEYLIGTLIEYVLNQLDSTKKIIMLYRISGKTQKWISERIGISQSYISKIEKKMMSEIKQVLNSNKKVDRGIFALTMDNNGYQVTFCLQNERDFKKVFEAILESAISSGITSCFQIKRGNNCVSIHIPQDIEYFQLISGFIEEVESFSIEFKSISLLEEDKIKMLANRPVVKKKSRAKKVREYFLAKDEFTVKELREHFATFKNSDIDNAIHKAKKEGLITQIERGKYSVNKD